MQWCLKIIWTLINDVHTGADLVKAGKLEYAKHGEVKNRISGIVGRSRSVYRKALGGNDSRPQVIPSLLLRKKLLKNKIDNMLIFKF